MAADRKNRSRPVKYYDVWLSANFCGFKIRPSVRSGELVNIRSTFMGHPVYATKFNLPKNNVLNFFNEIYILKMGLKSLEINKKT